VAWVQDSFVFYACQDGGTPWFELDGVQFDGGNFGYPVGCTLNGTENGMTYATAEQFFYAWDDAMLGAAVTYCTEYPEYCATSFDLAVGGGGPASGLPELTLEGGALIAGAIAALWATAWAFRVIRKQLSED